MKKPKSKRVGVRVDMTPMVDVAFLLLTFFMLTTQFRPPEDVVIELPSSHSSFKLPESDIMILSVDQSGKVNLGVDSQRLMVKLFGEGAKGRASVQIELKDLADVLMRARSANPKLRTVIRGDKEAPYGPIQDVMDILQKTLITRFNLVTDFERT